MNNDDAQTDPATTPTQTAPTFVQSGPLDARIASISPEAADELRKHVEAASGGGNRFVWFVLGFVAALVAGVVSSIVFLAISDDDDDGDIRLDVPEVQLDVNG